MRRIITGATGLIGKHLVNRWLSQNHQIIVVGRTKQRIQETFKDRVQAVSWQELSKEMLRSAEVVVNLAGANIAAKRWSKSRKKEVLTSRIDTTKQLAKLLADLGKDSPPLFNASAIGVYGLQKQVDSGLPVRLDESVSLDWNNPPDFLSRVGRQWEQAALDAVNNGVRVVFMRFGVVLSKDGGALPVLARPFYLFLGGSIGSGYQPFSWIALDDLMSAIDFLIPRKESGPFNFAAPECVQEQQLATTIGKVLHRPALFKMPGFAMKLLIGDEMAKELLLEGQHVYPKRLLELGFHFNYPTIESALKHILS